MLKATACLLLSALLFMKQKKKLQDRKDRLVFIVSFLAAVGITVAFCLGYAPPSPVKAVEFVYQPLSDRLYNFFQNYRAS